MRPASPVHQCLQALSGALELVHRVGAEFPEFVRDLTRAGVSSDRTGQRAI